MLEEKNRNISKTSLYIVTVVQRFKFWVIPVCRNVAYFEEKKLLFSITMAILLSNTDFLMRPYSR